MYLTKLHEPELGIMKAVGFMSGSGTNLVKIIEHQGKLERERRQSPYEIAAIFTDTPESNAEAISMKYGIPFVLNDFKNFCRKEGVSRKNLEARQEYDRKTFEMLAEYNAVAAAFAGYMLIATAPLIDAYLGVNVHPADLSEENPDGSRKYTGDHAVMDAILAGEYYLRSTTHIIEPKVDMGRILLVYEPLEVVLPPNFDSKNKQLVERIAKEHQDRLKEIGDWVIFPKTLEYIADGRYAMGDEGTLYFDRARIPKGLLYGNGGN